MSGWSFAANQPQIDADQAQSKNGDPRAKANSIGRRWTPIDADNEHNNQKKQEVIWTPMDAD